MGSSQSSCKKSAMDNPLADTPTSRRRTTRRRASAAGRNRDSSLLSPPQADVPNHRRSRSANPAPSTHASDHLAPPPPYSAAVPMHPPPLPPRDWPSQPQAVTRRASYNPPAPVTPPPRNPFRNMSINSRNAYLRTPIRRNTAENVLETLRKFNTVFIVDDSRSMEGSRWSEARNALAALADTAAKYDTDGIDVCFLNSPKSAMGTTSSAAVRQLFDSVRPRGITPIGEKLEELLLDYLGQLDDAKDSGNPAVFKAIKPVNYIVLTDGAPTDDPESVIVAAARRLDGRNYPMSQVGIQFVQIGDSPEATEYLNSLDDNLSSNYGVRDMVDTTPYTGGELDAEILTKILIGGINRRVDVRGAESVL